VKVGLYLDLRNPPQWRRPWADAYGAALELCEEAEAKGADSVWLSEHHSFADGYLPQPLTFAAAIAARTLRLRIGTAILIAPLRPAAQIAEDAALVDVISNGRLDLGLGAGYRAPEFELFGAPYRPTLDALFEQAGAVGELLAGELVTPGPIQDPLPIWMGCNGPVGARRAGRAGARLLSVQKPALDAYRAGRADAGLEPGDGATAGPVGLFLADDPDRAWPAVSPYLAYQWDTYAQAGVEGTGRPPPPPSDPDACRARGLAGGLRGCLVTTVDDALTQLRTHFAGYRIDTIFTWAWLPGVPDELVHRHVELLCTQLAPALAAES
jgi:alkanesulfonate monooxygenase SsuD/methylene tetrahydromethanopterin reductase-like flavin-dependent oxidoreductase (luciferase family)